MNTTADLERLLKSGIAAYQTGAYERAIALLSQLLRSHSHRLKAGMGLVRVYMAQQDWQEAQTLCQKIGRSTNPSVQKWSQKTLAKIENHIAQGRIAQDISDTDNAALSGFTPLSFDSADFEMADRELSDAPSSDSSGFEPLSSSPIAKPVQTTQSKSDSAKKDATDAQAQTASDIRQSERETQPVAQSIFHYAYLNSEAEDAVPVAATDALNATIQADCQWKYAGRLKQGRALGKMKKGQLWVAQAFGAAGFYFLARFLLDGAIALINSYLNFIAGLPLLGWIRPLPIYDATWYLLGAVGLVAIASPWLWDVWLSAIANRQKFSLNALRPFSAESATLVNQRCRQRRWPLPTLWRLPTEVPLIFSYGWLPRNARLVVSEGLLAQLKADEVAALVAYEMAQWKSVCWPLLSVCGLVLQIFHQGYWRLALWGNRQSKLLNLTAGFFATLSYCVFWLLRLPVLWMARVRTYYGDRTACEFTGNPNGLIRALGKVSFGLADAVAQQGYTPAIVESMEMLIPTVPDLARYQRYGRTALGSLYTWDSLNPVRGWMSLLDTHPPLGDRFALISAYARHWKLDIEIDLPVKNTPRQGRKARQKGLSKQDWSRLLSQGMPYFGLVFGPALGIFLWIVGAIAHKLTWPALDWMHKDTGLFWCCVLLSAGIGIILRINRFFPDLSFDGPLSTDWVHWLEEAELLPIESIPTQLSGTLIGRPGLANWLGQDLLLQTPDGLLKLHFFSAIGPAGNFLRLKERPAVPLGNAVQLLGWFRRGNRPWIDVDRIRLGNGIVIQAAHPIFSVAIATAACGLGLGLLI